jgi:hypothetical protein
LWPTFQRVFIIPIYAVNSSDYWHLLHMNGVLPWLPPMGGMSTPYSEHSGIVLRIVLYKYSTVLVLRKFPTRPKRLWYTWEGLRAPKLTNCMSQCTQEQYSHMAHNLS